MTATATKAARAPATAEHAWREVQEGRRGSGAVTPGSCANEAPGARQVTLGVATVRGGERPVTLSCDHP